MANQNLQNSMLKRLSSLGYLNTCYILLSARPYSEPRKGAGEEMIPAQ